MIERTFWPMVKPQEQQCLWNSGPALRSPQAAEELVGAAQPVRMGFVDAEKEFNPL